MSVLVSKHLGPVTKIVVGDDLLSGLEKSNRRSNRTVTFNVSDDDDFVLTHTSFGMKRFGFKGYLVNSYLRPVGFWHYR